MKNSIMVLILFLLIFLDQLTKFLFPGITNTGAAFGILQGKNILLIIISFIVVIAGIFYLKEHKDLRISLILILSGTTGNLIDRVLFGYVRDFIDFKYWPVFNLADSYNTIGALLLIYLVYFKKEKK